MVRAATSLLASLSWILAFTLGATLSSQPYRDELTHTLSALPMVVLTYTPPNIAVLSILAALSGAASNDKHTTFAHHRAVARGMFLHLILLSGLLIVSGTPFEATSQDQYIRLAGTASTLAFVIGWRPEALTAIIDRVVDFAQIKRAP